METPARGKLSLSLLMAVSLLAGCSLLGETGSPQQVARAEAINRFDENRAPYGQRLAAADAIYRPHVYGLNPYFGR